MYTLYILQVYTSRFEEKFENATNETLIFFQSRQTIKNNDYVNISAFYVNTDICVN